MFASKKLRQLLHLASLIILHVLVVKGHGMVGVHLGLCGIEGVIQPHVDITLSTNTQDEVLHVKFDGSFKALEHLCVVQVCNLDIVGLLVALLLSLIHI